MILGCYLMLWESMEYLPGTIEALQITHQHHAICKKDIFFNSFCFFCRKCSNPMSFFFFTKTNMGTWIVNVQYVEYFLPCAAVLDMYGGAVLTIFSKINVYYYKYFKYFVLMTIQMFFSFLKR